MNPCMRKRPRLRRARKNPINLAYRLVAKEGLKWGKAYANNLTPQQRKGDSQSRVLAVANKDNDGGTSEEN